MADINLEAVAGKLNRIGYEALFKALRQAKGAGNRNVELAHWLVHDRGYLHYVRAVVISVAPKGNKCMRHMMQVGRHRCDYSLSVHLQFS